MDPVVLVLSYGATITPLEIVKSNNYLPKNEQRIILSRASCLSQDVIKTLLEIRVKETQYPLSRVFVTSLNILAEMEQPKESSSTECNLNCYKCAIKTKYYNTSINLIPFTGKLESVPEDILQATEALIIYFDPKDTSFIDTIPNTLSKNEQIQLGFLLTTSSSGGEGGMSFGELKERTNFFFDIITLKKGNTPESDSDETEKEYEEVVEGLRNVVWSNVTMGSKESKEDISNDELDNQLKDFENLLLTAQSLRNDTSLTREQFLDRAEQFAGIVSAILNDNDSD